MAQEVAVVQVSNWPAQCSPLSTVFDLVKLVDEESFRATEGRRDRPILVLDRSVHRAPTPYPPPPSTVRVAKTGRNHLNEEITPLLPTGIGVRFSQTISNQM